LNNIENYTMMSENKENKNMRIEEFNKTLVEEKIEFTINEYIEVVNDKFYDIDISFMKDFQDLVSKDECCIHHEML